MKNAIVIAFVEVVAVEFDSFDPCMETEITAKNLGFDFIPVYLYRCLLFHCFNARETSFDQRSGVLILT